MRVAQSVAEILSKHVVLEVEGIDRMNLNVYVPRLQIARRFVWLCAVGGPLNFHRRRRHYERFR